MYNFIFCLDYEFNTYLCVLLFKYYIYVIITAHLYRREFYLQNSFFSSDSLYFYLRMCFASHGADFAAK